MKIGLCAAVDKYFLITSEYSLADNRLVCFNTGGSQGQSILEDDSDEALINRLMKTSSGGSIRKKMLKVFSRDDLKKMVKKLPKPTFGLMLRSNPKIDSSFHEPSLKK